MKKNSIKYTLNKGLCSVGLASILAITGCGSKTGVDDVSLSQNVNTSSKNLVENVEVNQSNEDKPLIKISIFASTEEELVKQLTDLGHDLPLIKDNYNLKVLEIGGGTYFTCNQETKKLLEDVLLSCEDLSSLTIDRIKLTSEDLLFISNFSNLTSLCLTSLRLEDPSFLANLVGLENLNLSLNPITDISSLDSLINLKKLNISGTYITDFSVIKCMPFLTDFSISSCAFLNPEFTQQPFYRTREEIEELITLSETFTGSYVFEFLNN